MLRKSFSGSNQELQLRHNTLEAPVGTVFFGAFDGVRLIGINGFIRHSILFGRRRLAAFQSCSTATDADYRGRGVLTAIIRHAQTALVEEGCLIFGFPNEKSKPIFVGALGFRGVPLTKMIIPCFSLALYSRGGRLAKATSAATRGSIIYFDQDEVFNWKLAISGSNVRKQSIPGMSIWGHDYVKRIAGHRIRGFVIGGASCKPSSNSATEVVADNRIRSPFFYTLTTTADSAIVSAMRYSIKKKSPASLYTIYWILHLPIVGLSYSEGWLTSI